MKACCHTDSEAKPGLQRSSFKNTPRNESFILRKSKGHQAYVSHDQNSSSQCEPDQQNISRQWGKESTEQGEHNDRHESADERTDGVPGQSLLSL